MQATGSSEQNKKSPGTDDDQSREKFYILNHIVKTLEYALAELA